MPQQKGLARIFQPPKSAMQSGRAKSQGWVLEYEPSEAKALDPLTGWVGSGDMLGQVRLKFESREQAVAYAAANGIAYEVEATPPSAAIKPKVYADNFRFGRLENWSH
ncbi:ETC complex I subunit [Neoroseomonas oryzicola]|uniref:ETC complex I subunit n=1 Tax=Neoroseomonas oryzicola TaxID=535904 RepID=A0A9X9WFX7_9PROT|nr:ETC complex I subunit [Neoroseomonas oryzicola]MBR0659237.1 ETC complex I subunit [Neoroseomonas oryzicola]NKE15629.1 ETC complex I subunit [Neoroseomonas oryzicola]